MPLPSATRTVGKELGDLRLAFGVLRVPFAWGVMFLSLAGTALVIAVLAALVWWLVVRSGGQQAGWLAGTRWDEWVLGGMGSVVVLVIGWFTFPAVVTAVAGMFLEPLADRIEKRHYPELPVPRQVPLGEQVHASLRGLLRGLGWNLLGLPFYFVPGVNLIAYAIINATLLSREYFQIVALRHMGMGPAKQLYRQHRWPMVRGGLVLAGLFVVPGMNLLAPLLATAWMVHRVWRRGNSPLRAALGEGTIRTQASAPV